MSTTCELITGVGEDNHISSVDDAKMYYGMFGPGYFALKTDNELGYAMNNANTFILKTGDLMMYGRHVRIPAQVSLNVSTNDLGKTGLILLFADTLPTQLQ